MCFLSYILWKLCCNRGNMTENWHFRYSWICLVRFMSNKSVYYLGILDKVLNVKTTIYKNQERDYTACHLKKLTIGIRQSKDDLIRPPHVICSTIYKHRLSLKDRLLLLGHILQVKIRRNFILLFDKCSTFIYLLIPSWRWMLKSIIFNNFFVFLSILTIFWSSGLRHFLRNKGLTTITCFRFENRTSIYFDLILREDNIASHKNLYYWLNIVYICTLYHMLKKAYRK